MEGARLLDGEELRKRTREVDGDGLSRRMEELGPFRTWLKFACVERTLGMPSGKFSLFVCSIQHEERGSTRGI